MQKDEENRLRAENAKLRDNMAEAKRRHSAERDALHDELAKSKARLEQVEEEKLTKTKQIHKRLRQTERLLVRLKRAEAEVAATKFELGRTKAELSEARRQCDREKIVHESQLRALRSEVPSISRARDELVAQLNAVTNEADELRTRSDFLNQIAATERAYKEAVENTEHLRRRLRIEQSRRIAAEKRIEQLLKDYAIKKNSTQSVGHDPAVLTSPALGQYQRHAAVAGYDIASDPLFDLMRRDVLVADRYASWQAHNMQRMTSRRREPEQSLAEQAYAAALSIRWRLIDHPHIRLGTAPKWSLLGFMLDEKSEKYLVTIANERIEEMERRMGNMGQ